MRDLAARGLRIIFVTSDLDEALALSDRIALMSQGKLTSVFDCVEPAEAKIIAASSVGRYHEAALLPAASTFASAPSLSSAE